MEILSSRLSTSGALDWQALTVLFHFDGDRGHLVEIIDSGSPLRPLAMTAAVRRRERVDNCRGIGFRL